MSTETQIKCPSCGTSIDVQNILAHQLEDELKKKYTAQLAEEKKRSATQTSTASSPQKLAEQHKRFVFF